MAPTPNKPFDAARTFGTSFRSQLSSFSASSPIAEAAIARDLEEDSDYDSDGATGEEESDTSTVKPGGYDMAEGYRRPSFIAVGPHSTVVPGSLPEHGYLSKHERELARNEERSLLRDNNLIPPKHPRPSGSIEHFGARLSKQLSLPGRLKGRSEDVESTAYSEGYAARREPSETTALLRDPTKPYGGEDTPTNIDRKWEEAVVAGIIHTTWQREAKVLGRYSRSLILTFILQYSLVVASVFTVGHIGKIELGAVSLASMTANITGYAVYQGLATSLDTLCAQAYGSGRKKLVGLQMQRMVYFLWACTIPIGIIWLSGTQILKAIVPEKETAELAGVYLKIVLLGAPGYAAFEAGKRYVQAQGLFSATLYCLLICAPLNAFMHWLFVWRFKWGFVGAPIAVAVTENMLPLCLFLYVRFINGQECWGGFEKRALKHWGPMIRLALPGLVMVLAEFLAFEILTFSSSWISSTALAAQSVLTTITTLTYQIPFPLSIAMSTRIANLIGATLADAGKMAAKVGIVVACFVGILNITLLSALKDIVPYLFTDDEVVIEVVSNLLPLCAAFQLFDALAASCNGILRGLGRQEIGGYTNLFAYYAFALPISFGAGFGLHWGLYGLWSGPALGLGLVAAIEGLFIYKTNWERAVEEARMRNAIG